MREIVLDTETTGLDPKGGDRLIEIGCIELLNRIPTGREYHCYINPERDVPAEAEAVAAAPGALVRLPWGALLPRRLPVEAAGLRAGPEPQSRPEAAGLRAGPEPQSRPEAAGLRAGRSASAPRIATCSPVQAPV